MVLAVFIYSPLRRSDGWSAHGSVDLLQHQPKFGETAGDGAGRITLVLGGVRSGKSRYAQQLAAQAERVTVIATAQAHGDEEMEERIARHCAERPAHWRTVEEPLELSGAIRTAAVECDLILVDCLTLYAANLLDRFPEDRGSIEAAFRELLESLGGSDCRVVLVANEVGSGIVPEYPSGRRFRDLAGELNQRVAAVADRVLLMVAGLPLVLKEGQA